MSSLLDIFISFSLSQLLLCAVLLTRQGGPRPPAERLFAALLLATGGYLLSPWLDPTPYSLASNIAQGAIPSLIWLFSYSLFDDEFRLKTWQLVPFIITVVLPQINRAAGFEPPSLSHLLLAELPRWSEFLLLGWALVIILRNWRDDLLEQRRSLRLWFSLFIGFYATALIAAREIFFPDAKWLEIWQYAPAGLMLLLCNCVLLEFSNAIFRPTKSRCGSDLSPQFVLAQNAPAPSTPTQSIPTQSPPVQSQAETPAEEVPTQVLSAITELMEVECIYREMGLTIGALAERLGIQEYRLRKIINAGLGYRNFNEFLNRYRVQEACRRLGDADEAGTAVLNIALDAGFRSLSSFNKAFKDSQGLTPSAYRQRALGEN
ncbi:MAG: helix-turn-helix domain-containing protein [Cellvibrionaceae bacterium]|nr:helix-turn-helix domain-containing protein [Cellvibrionaceae bacterium]